MSSTATIDQFLAEISQILREKDALKLRDYLVIEPPYSDLYHSMINELRSAFPSNSENRLEAKCSSALPDGLGEDNATWTAFTKFMVQYFGFLRDVDVQNLLETYNLLSELVQCVVPDPKSDLETLTLGVLILPTVITYSQMLSRLAIGLDKRPELIAHLTKQSVDESGARETLPERAANIIRQAFVTCLNDRSSVKGGKPEGRRVGIYKVANLCLKVLFQCRKTRNAEQMFVNIDNQSPPLAYYPRSERVTYLYYLGRFLFSTSHFRRAQLTLQAAYEQCHAQCVKQRRLVLIYLVASSIILGRFPSNALLQRPEAAGLAEKFQPICLAIRQGNLAAFRKWLDVEGPYFEWFRHYRIRLQLQNRCEVLVWRSLFRKTFLLNGSIPAADSRNAPTFALDDVLSLARFLEKRASSTKNTEQPGKPGARHTNWIFMEQPDAKEETYIDPDLDGADDEIDGSNLPDMMEIESIASSLVVQKLLNGFVSHKQLRFAITGAKRKPALAAGFPNVWQTITSTTDQKVPGWVQETKTAMPGGFGPGLVVNLKGARAAGAGP